MVDAKKKAGSFHPPSAIHHPPSTLPSSPSPIRHFHLVGIAGVGMSALAQGLILGAGLDVFEREPPDVAHPIFGLENVVVTNHIGWYSEEAMRDVQRKAAEEAVRVLSGEAPLHWLNRW